MAHIKLPEGLPGILGPMTVNPETTKALGDLAEALLRGSNTLTSAEREIIAAYVSSENDCRFCALSHGAAAAEHLGGNYALIDELKKNFKTAPVSDKLKALLAIAGKVREGGKHVTGADVERARELGASDKEIHDTVLIAAAFSMFNRYVDGLDTWQPENPEAYREMGKMLATSGYVRSAARRPAVAGAK